MPVRDAPDQYGQQPSSAFDIIGDMGELAARLGSASSYDRSGAVVFVDDMAHSTSPYQIALSGPDSSIVPSTINTGSSGYSLKLTSATTVDSRAEIKRSFIIPTLDKLGMEVSFIPSVTNQEIDLTMTYYKPPISHVAIIRLITNTGAVQYKNAAGSFVTLYTIDSLNWSFSYWNNLKLVVDTENNLYHRLRFGRRLNNMGFPVFSTDDGVHEDFVGMSLLIRSKSAVQGSIYVGSFVVTYGEP